jgi:hypothetical protein
MQKIAGWDHWPISFDRAGTADAAARAALLDEVARAGLTDLIVMSHGWNASSEAAAGLT